MEDKIPIYTIGYGNRSLEEFIEVIKQHGIEYLIDVRSVPFSRYKPEFSKTILSKQLSRHNIRYVFLGDELGGRPKGPSLNDNEGKVDYSKVRKTDFYRSGIDRLCKAFERQEVVALMCSEGKPENCHRSKLIGETLIGERKIKTLHIDENNNLVSHEKVIERVSGRGRQMSFGLDGVPVNGGYRSKKRYP